MAMYIARQDKVHVHCAPQSRRLPRRHVPDALECRTHHGKVKRDYLSEDDKMVDDSYSPEKFANAPLGLQVVTQRWEDEKCMEVLKIISKVVNAK